MFFVLFAFVVLTLQFTDTMTICNGFKGFSCPKRWLKENRKYRSHLNVPTRTTPVFYKSVATNCEYKGYKPGNSTTMSSVLQAPVSVVVAEGMMQVLSQTNNISNNLPALERINFKPESLADKFFQKTKKSAPELGVTLGIFASFVGEPIRKEVPDIDDIVHSLDKAVELIAKDADGKMESVRGYVNNRFLEDRKSYTNKKYKHAFTKLKSCLQKKSIEKSDECQEALYGYIFALKQEYCVWVRRVMTGTLLDDLSVRELEAALVPARNFANLMLLILKPLVEIYRSKSSVLKNAPKFQKLFEMEMVAQVEYFTEYFLNAASIIVKYHEEKGSTCNSIEGVHCSPVIMAGSERTHECSCVISKALNQQCLDEIIMDVKGGDPWELVNQGWDLSYTVMYMDTGEDGEVAKRIAQKNLQGLDRAHKNAIKEDIQKFLDKEILSFLPVWGEYKKWALKDGESGNVGKSKRRRKESAYAKIDA